MANQVLQMSLFAWIKLGFTRINQAVFQGICRRLGPVLQVQLIEDILQMALDRIDRYREFLGDLLVAGAACHETKNEQFALSEGLLAFFAISHAICHNLEESTGHRAGHGRLAVCHTG